MMNTTKRVMCLLLAAVLCAGLSGCSTAEVRAIYRQGCNAMDAGRYAEAAAHFGTLGDYRKSEQYLDEIYGQAMALYRSGEFRKAEEIFQALAAWNVQDASLYVRLSQAEACLKELDAAGAYAALDQADPAAEMVQALIRRLEGLCFADTVLIRPENVASELTSSRVTPEITSISGDPYLDEIVYIMPKNAADSVYSQYRDYCRTAFPASFSDGSDSYFTFQIDGATYYVCNYWALYGGLVIKIPRY